MKKIIFITTLILTIYNPSIIYCQSENVISKPIIEGPRIGLVQDVVIDNRDNIFVGDLINLKVHKYNENEKHISSLGREGQGPGEFRSVAGMRIGTNDSLYVYDRDARRITVFPPASSSSSRTVQVSPGPGQLSPNNLGSLTTGLEGLWLTTDGRPLIAYSRPIDPRRELNKDRQLELRFADTPAKTSPILRLPDRQMLTLDVNGRSQLTLMPFGKRPVVEMGAENSLYFGYPDDLTIHKKQIGDSVQTVISHKFSRVELSDELLRSRLEKENEEDLLSNFDTVREKAPSHVPAFEDFEIDNNGRVWVAVNTRKALKNGNTEYWVFAPNGKLLKKASLNRIVFLKAFTDTNAYGIATKPNGAQQIVRVSLDTLLP